MKKLFVIVLGALALSFNACEMHKASELAEEHDGAGAEKEASSSEPATKAEEKPSADAKPGEAPKFFPEKK